MIQNKLLKNTADVLPSPFKILASVPVRYRNGQIKERIRRKEPQSSLSKRSIPSSLPQKKKSPVQKMPSTRQPDTVFSTVSANFFALCVDCASETAGSSSVDRDIVTADGNSKRGSVIPVSTPYRLKDSEEVRPYRRSLAGIHRASILCRKFRTTRFKVIGNESDKMDFA